VPTNEGKLVISLDFELYWGVRDKMNLAEYGENIEGVHTVVPRLLDLFNAYSVKATFATVGFLFFETKKDLVNNIPCIVPGYSLPELSPYTGYINSIGDEYKTDVYHYAPNLIKLILQHPQHEIGSHTFSHYYCLEDGQTIDEFRADLLAAQKIANRHGISLKSLVFPRNQFNDEYLSVCKELGIICYRGNEKSWLYTAKKGSDEKLYKRACRFLDSYINISGFNCYSPNELFTKESPINIPSSSFLRPYNRKLRLFENLRLKRIKSAMTHAAKHGLIYHLWWHPHNFGINQHENFCFLEAVLKHYEQLNSKYNFQSLTMTELANRFYEFK
jgi:peptidoglycan/xylan/chitin deacetylase (PgdA/CDA1 family)